MAWIESHTVLLRHRKLIELAQDLRLAPVYVMGHLHALWHAALEQQEDGDLSSWSDQFIAEMASFPGDAPQFVRLLQRHEWLDGKLLHHWLDYAGKYLTAKYRTANPKRLRQILLKYKSAYSRSKVGRSPIRLSSHKVGSESFSRKGEFEGETLFEEFWAFYPRKHDKGAAVVKWKATVKRGAKPDDLVLAAKNYQISMRDTEEKYIKHGATFLGPTEPWREYLDGPRIPESKQDLQSKKIREALKQGL